MTRLALSRREKLGAALLLALAAALARLWSGSGGAAPAAGPCPECPEAVVQVARPFRPVDFSSDFYGLVYRGNSGNFIDLHVLMYGAFEKPLLYFMRDALKSLHPGGGIFVDVGANTGHHSLFMSRHALRVHAFEPYEPVLERFRAMVAENGVGNIAIHPIGLGSEHARLPFHEPPPRNLGTGSFVQGFKADNRSAGELEIAPGDELLAAEAEPIDLIKIDVEGYERPVLQGLRGTLERSRPVVVAEISIDPALPGLFRSLGELRDTLPAEYALLRFEKNELWRLSGAYRLVPTDLDFAVKQQHDLVAIPEEKRGLVPLSGRGSDAGPRRSKRGQSRRRTRAARCPASGSWCRSRS